MGLTNRQRVREWREKKAREGGRSLSVWMEPEIAKQLDRIKGISGEPNSLVVARAIKTLHDITCNIDDALSPHHSDEVMPGERAPGTAGEISPVTVAHKDGVVARADITCNDSGGVDGERHIAAAEDSIAAILHTFEEKRDFSSIHQRLTNLLRHKVDGGVPYSSLMKELNEAGLPTPEGETTWRRGTIFGLLR